MIALVMVFATMVCANVVIHIPVLVVICHAVRKIAIIRVFVLCRNVFAIPHSTETPANTFAAKTTASAMGTASRVNAIVKMVSVEMIVVTRKM